MNRFTLTPRDTRVGASTMLDITFNAKHDFPQGGSIFITFPKWNQAAGTAAKSYIQGGASCAPNQALSEDMSCEFKNDVLEVKRSAANTVGANNDMSFSVTGFRNPIQASLINGFKI